MYVYCVHGRGRTNILTTKIQGKPWPLLAVGFGVCGLGLGSLNAIALSYLMDCYQEVSHYGSYRTYYSSSTSNPKFSSLG